MPRHARLDAEGVLHHIIVHGIERRLIFRDYTSSASGLCDRDVPLRGQLSFST